MSTHCCTTNSPVGRLTLVAEDDCLVALRMEGQKWEQEGPSAALPAPTVPTGATAAALSWLDAYWAGKKPAPSALPLKLVGSAFRRRVWQTLMALPYGTTVTYGELARRLGSSPRAVGGAVGHNPLAIIIPCHRVVAANGPGGYAGGLSRKQRLLEHEQSTR